MTALTSSLALVIGAGGVGCAVMTECLQRSGALVVAVTRTAGTAAALQRDGSRVRSTARVRPDRVVRPDVAVPFSDVVEVVHHLQRASTVVVAVGAQQLAPLAPVLAAGLHARPDPVNILVCDNRVGAAEQLRALVADHSEDSFGHHGFVGTLVERIVTRHYDEDGSPLLVAEDDGSILTDARALRAPLPAASDLEPVEDFTARVLRKLFLFSAGHAASAYLGELRGHTHLRTALADETVHRVVRAAMLEGQAGLAELFGVTLSGGPDHVDACLRRFADPTLDDTVARVGRDPLRKLGPQDRICGPARLALASGVPTPALGLVAAAALSSVEARGLHPRRTGRGDLLSGSTGLPWGHPFLRYVEVARRALCEEVLLEAAWSRLKDSPRHARRPAASYLRSGTG